MVCKRVYSADGIKLKARHITAIPQDGTGSSSSSTNYIMSKDSTDYIGDFIYHNNKFSKYNWGNGYIVPAGSSSGYAYRFYFKDHQGNNRLVTTSTGTVKQTTHYYPDGVTHDKSTGQGEQVYKYNGKELDRMHGLDWYDYGAREYDPTIGQFISMDPHCEKYYNVSPYVYCHSNPVMRIDPDGKDDWVLRKSGQLILLRIGGEVDNIQYGKKSFSIAHGAFGKTTEKMIRKDFSGRNANFKNVKDGLKFMRIVSKYTEKELSGVGISNKVGNAVKRLEVSAWNKNGLGRNAKGGISNVAYGTYTISNKERVKYTIHTHPQVSGIPHSGKSTASDKDRANMLNFPDGTMHFITTPSNNQTYEFTKTHDGTTDWLSDEDGVLY